MADFLSSRVEKDIRILDEHVAALQAAFNQKPPRPQDKAWVRKKLKHMVEVDQYCRFYFDKPAEQKYSAAEKEEFEREIHPRCQKIDRENTADLKELMKIWGWFTISSFGAKADANAWLLAQHADRDPPFQRQVLSLLEDLYPKNETSRRNYAYLYDRVACSFNDASRRKPQRYGTQGDYNASGEFVPLDVEDPAHLEERRQQMGLKPVVPRLAQKNSLK